MAVKIHVIYCGGWGYRPKFEQLKAQILDEFEASQVEITSEPTKETSGALEVNVNGQLIHSKLTKGLFTPHGSIFNLCLGDGYIDSDKKLNAIFDAIQAAL